MVGFFPTALAVALVLVMVKSGAPQEPLTLNGVQAAASDLGVGGGVVILVVAAAVSVTLQPLQFRLVQWLEGYWSLRPRGPLVVIGVLFRLGIWRQRRRFDRAVEALSYSSTHARPIDRVRAQAAEESLRLRFPKPERLLPTALGNVLRSSEDRAALRYNINSVNLWPRLFPLLPPDHAAGIEDEVTALDVAVRLVITWLGSAAAGTALLLRHPAQAVTHWQWVVVVAVMVLLAQLSYRAAIESALAHGRDIEIAIDLYRGRVLDATRMPVPGKLSEERATLNALEGLFTSYSPDQPAELDYRPS
ncbi:hypothetical protein ACXR2U_01050 [Jatrophihabitans sp. YIM 134969]